uniref:Plethodontid modulating factor n=1 Tax=Plethodon yonahlossee TaxID=8337 RepID=Q0GAK0_PLEYO|nr:plethodontid modulating factor [Plethodon yonahlossee]ABI48765.1 plethodontid modulating factor [Plethodon yonahlossee]ABI48766.1 plethodontid modulating factor [Plethodon yonahlossee]
MRTTALLILLVVLVSTGEALQCNTLDGGTEECPSDDYNACVHYKYEDVEFMGCQTQPFCDTVKDALAAEGSEGVFICCSEDLCN